MLQQQLWALAAPHRPLRRPSSNRHCTQHWWTAVLCFTWPGLQSRIVNFPLSRSWLPHWTPITTTIIITSSSSSSTITNSNHNSSSFSIIFSMAQWAVFETAPQHVLTTAARRQLWVEIAAAPESHQEPATAAATIAPTPPRRPPLQAEGALQCTMAIRMKCGRACSTAFPLFLWSWTVRSGSVWRRSPTHCWKALVTMKFTIGKISL